MADPFKALTDAARTSNALRVGARMISFKLNATVKLYGYALSRQVKANASGRPGPRVQTGDYRRSINVRFSVQTLPHIGVGATSATVGTNSPQGRRLEYGFMDMTDSLGRLFHQPPLPHFGPAFNFIAPQFEAAVERDVRDVVDAVLIANRNLEDLL